MQSSEYFSKHYCGCLQDREQEEMGFLVKYTGNYELSHRFVCNQLSQALHIAQLEGRPIANSQT